ncbi:DUF3597 family protein [Bacillus sp. FSL K6-3431]|uniref:DUF3597 family protein n=1 Tax=Bacillus sp. FSL K6-3431 TaxID=2921500 RepID=UPI0030F60DAB
MNIKQQLVFNRSNTYGLGNPCNFITIHETANYDKGAGAQTHANLQSNGYSASWHYQVDDKEVIQSFSDDVQCWHAGDSRGKGNLESIGIEICVNIDSDFKKAVENAAKLVKILMNRHKIALINVVQHNRWSGKDCPHNLRNGSKGISWGDFVNIVNELVKDEPIENKPTKTESGPVQSKPVQSTTINKQTSIVDWMKLNGMDPSYVNRTKLAGQYGIKDYKGTAAQNITLLNKLKGDRPVMNSKPKSTVNTNSIIDWMKANKLDSSYSNRAKLAEKYGVKNYTGTAGQNIALLNKLKGDQPVMNPNPTSTVNTNSIIDWMKANKLDSSYSHRAKLAEKYGIKNYTGTAGQNITLLNKLKGK